MKEYFKKGWILEQDLEHDAQNSYPLMSEKKVIKSEQMSGYQKHLMADLNLDPPNGKTLVLTLLVTLRGMSPKNTKPLSGVLGGRSCLAPARTFSRRWQGGCHSHLTFGNKIWGPEGSLSNPSYLLGRAGPSGNCRVRQPHPITPNERLHVPCKELVGAIPYIQRHHHLHAILLYKVNGLYMTQTLFS